MKTKSQLNSSGIYKISNPTSKKVYIGSAFNIRKRWKAHRTSLRNNKHINRYLQSSVNKYGLSKFQFEVIEFIAANENTEELKEKLLSREQYWIDKFKSWDRKCGYNLSPTAGSPLGVKHSKESRARMSEAHKGIKHDKKTKEKISKSQYKSVYQICIDTGKILDKFESVIAASKKTKIQKTGISMCCRNVIRQSGGYHWTYDPTSFEKPTLKRKTIERPWKRKAVSNGKKVWPSVIAACNELKIGWNIFKQKRDMGEFFYV